MFSQIVELYRRLGRPDTNGDRFEFNGVASPSTISLANEVEQLPSHFGSFTYFKATENTLDVEVNLPSSEAGRFHKNLADFITSTPSLNFGELPSQFYICSLDFYSGENPVNEKLACLYNLSRFVRSLSKLAANTFGHVDAGQNDNRLVFVVAADGKSPSKTLTLNVSVSEELLNYGLPHVKLLESLLSEKRKNDVHVEERLSIMRLAIADSLSSLTDEQERFQHLVRNWPTILSKYHHNFLAFIHQYSFEKVRKEIATAEIENATKMSAVLGDITGKLLAIPVSLAAVVLLRKAVSPDEFWIGFVGLACVTVIFVGLLLNQWLQVLRLRGSFHVIFDQYDVSKFPPKLSRPVVNARKNAVYQFRVIIGTFLVLTALAALPLLGAIYMAMDRGVINLTDVCVRIAR